MAEEFPYMPLYWRDWLTGQSTTFMTAEQEGGFLNLLLRAWGADPACTVPDDDGKLAQLSKMGSRWKRYGAVVREQFESIGDGLLRNPKQWAVYLEMMEHRERRKVAGSKGGKAKADRSNATAMPEHSPSNGLANEVAKSCPSSASALSEEQITDANASGAADAAPLVDNFRQSVGEWLGVFMPILRECGFEADDTDGSILKHWHKKNFRADEVEAAIRGTALIRQQGGLKAFEGVKLSLRLLYARPKEGRPVELRPLWNEAIELYHRDLERSKRRDPNRGNDIKSILNHMKAG